MQTPHRNIYASSLIYLFSKMSSENKRLLLYENSLNISFFFFKKVEIFETWSYIVALNFFLIYSVNTLRLKNSHNIYTKIYHFHIKGKKIKIYLIQTMNCLQTVSFITRAQVLFFMNCA